MTTLTGERRITGEHWVSRAQEIATCAHRGQTDKSGQPYIGHPARVARRASTMAITQEQGWLAEAAGWLHDVVEDTPVTLAELKREFPQEIWEAVDAVTKRIGEPVEQYCRRIRALPIAVIVKKADIADSTDPLRTAALEPATRERLAAKYEKVLGLLDLIA